MLKQSARSTISQTEPRLAGTQKREGADHIQTTLRSPEWSYQIISLLLLPFGHHAIDDEYAAVKVASGTVGDAVRL